MGKTLLNKIGNAVKRSVFAGLIGLSFAACNPYVNPIPEKTDSAPTVTMSASKTAIKVGESVPIKFVWEDKDGNEDLTNYSLGIDKNGNDKIDVNEELVKQSTPFTDYTFTPTSAGNFKLIAQDTDKAGLTGKANLEINVSEDIIPPTNSIPTITSIPPTTVNEGSSYSYQLIANDSEGDKLVYSLKRPSWMSVDSSGLITGSVPDVTADTNYDVEIEVSDGTNVTTQDWTLVEKDMSGTPLINLNKINLVEEIKKDISLPSVDSDGNAVSYTSALKKSGDISVSRSDNVLTLISNNITQDENYSVTLNFKDIKTGKSGNATLEGKIENLCDITGNIQDNETHTTQAGEVRLYDSSGNLLGDKTTTDGNFTIQASSPSSQIKLRAKLNNSNGSYIRTIILDGTKDYNLTDNLTDKIRVVPYGYLDGSTFSHNDFKEFMREINISQTPDEYEKELGLRKSIARHFEILRTNYQGSSFSSLGQKILANKITSLEDIRKFVNKEELFVQIDEENNSNLNGNHYKLDSYNNIISIDSGWILIVPNNNLNSFENPIGGKTISGYLNDDRTKGVIDRSIIEIRPEHAVVDDPEFEHEGGHALNAFNDEATKLSSDLTIMNIDWDIIKPGVADEKAGKIIYEKTYLPREKLDDILGMN